MEALLTHGLILTGDKIQFVFKGHTVTGTVAMGGHIVNTTGVTHDISQHVYPSLTAWSEACLLEGLREDNCRYASWRRVIHCRSGRTLQSLRSQHNVDIKKDNASRQDLYLEINRLRQCVHVLRQPRTVAAPTTAVDALLATPHVKECFERWATSSHRF